MQIFSNRSIRTKLLVAFVLAGLIPLAIATVGGGNLASNALMEKSFDQIASIQAIRKKQVELAILERMDDLKALAAGRDIRDLARILADHGREQRLAPHDGFPVNSEAYRKLTQGYDKILKEISAAYGFRDLLLVSAEHGRVMFSVAKEDDLGTNLESGRYARSGLAEAWRESLKSGGSSMVDFAPHGASGGAQRAFMGYPVKGPDGAAIAVAVVLLNAGFIDEIMDSREGMGETGESYLIAQDKTAGKMAFRSAMRTMGEGKYVIGYVPGFSLSYWDAAASGGLKGGIGEYVDSAGKGVLVAFNKLDVPGVDWFLISKIDKREVMLPLKDMAVNAALTGLALAALIGAAALLISRNFTRPILEDMEFAEAISHGKLDSVLEVKRNDELGQLGRALNAMAANLSLQAWFQNGKQSLDDAMRGEMGRITLAGRFISAMVRQLDAQLGAFYLAGDDGVLMLAASHAFSDREGNFNRVWPGEGLVGQAVLEKKTIIFTNVAEASPMLNYGAGELKPAHYMVSPLYAGEELIGAFLIGSVAPFEERHRRFVEENAPNAAVLMNAAKSRRTIRDLLSQAQAQQEKLAQANRGLEEQAQALRESESELQAQQEELRVTNEELEEQTKALKESQAELQAQQEELQVINEELEEQTQTLSDQKEHIQKKNLELVKAQSAINQKARELEVASRYKSEFLANMSHELRTPLNSILILSQLLSGNRDENLTSKQVEAAKAINTSGAELLKLINDILDLSKVEAGKIELQVTQNNMGDFLADLRRVFREQAEEKGLDFVIERLEGSPETIRTDSHRLQQVLRNLLSNAFKFTAEGTVTVRVRRPEPEEVELTGLDPATSVAFSVIDQGIGIPADKQALIFEAFKQADGSTSRTYGGTGLGLSISRELTKLLGGVIRLKSAIGEGSEFTVILPEEYAGPAGESVTAAKRAGGEAAVEGAPAPAAEQAPATPIPTPPAEPARAEAAPPASPPPPAAVEDVKDDRKSLAPGDKTLLVIEDDPRFCEVLRDLAHERGFKCLVAGDGETGLHFADYHRPNAIILDIGLPGIDGWTVMERLKANPDTRHIPVHFMSASDSSLDAMRMGAVGFLTKPVSLEKIDEAMSRIEKILSRSMSRLLVVEDDDIQRESIRSLIGNGDVKTTAVRTGAEALDELSTDQYDCMILDLGLEDMSGFDLLERIRSGKNLPRVPIIIYTGRDITREEEAQLARYAESIIIKGARSPERLVEETALFLHRVESSMPQEKQRRLKLVHDKDAILSGRRILLVDDDMRNVFALTSVLEEKGINPIIARNGLECLEKLKENPDTDLILMDIMMPKMDGYEAMRAIRKDPRHKKLPIIALTAKAMAGDRAKCIDAGASDYLAKPVNTDKLISMLRVWLYK